MAKFPVEIGDDEGTAEAVNYLLSGPAGLGQYFSGYSSYMPAWLTGNYRIPFTQDTLASLYVAPISLSTSELLDPRTFKFTFSSTQPSPPFNLGAGVTVNGTRDPGLYDGSYTPIGVIECTTDYVICRTNTGYTGSPASGGTIEYTTTGDFFNSTDANGRVIVTGGTDRVFISGQLDNLISYTVFSGPAVLEYTVALNRFLGFLNPDPTNPDYLFLPDKTVAQKVYTFDGLSGTGTLPLNDCIFSTFIDQPVPGFYWYILEVKFRSIVGDLQVTDSLFGLRSLTAQVVKQ